MNIKDLNLSIDEKITLLTGQSVFQTSSLNGKIKSVCMGDASSGLRKDKDNTFNDCTPIIYPSLSMIANSWDKDMSYLLANTLADDFIDSKVDIVLGPGINIKRTPLCGRNFEYFSEDPFLAGTLAYNYIKGIQDKGIGACPKHYACNNREFDRFYQSSEVDNRTLHEIYTKAFKMAVDAKPFMIMTSYNPVNGVYAAENKKLLKNILRDEYGFDGVIVSDWNAVSNRYKSLKASLDLDMPYRPNSFNELKNAYLNGLISEKEIDTAAENILNLVSRCNNNLKITTTSLDERKEISKKIAIESMVLLKNEDNILPLKKNQSIAIIGRLSETPTIVGGGAAYMLPKDKPKGLKAALSELINNDIKFVNYYHNYPYFSTDTVMGLKNAIMEAYSRDIAIVYVGNNKFEETEERDRHTIKLSPNQEKLIKEIANVNKNVIVIVNSGSAIDMSNWINDVKAVVYAGFSGEKMNEALALLLAGKECFSGKLSETFPLSLEDTFVKDDRNNAFYERYSDGVLVGYRYYDYYKKDVLFPFGYGLSYAKFDYSNLKIDKISELDYKVSFDITNNSDIDAKEVSELYVKDVFTTVTRPILELKGFSKNLIKAHETKNVTISLNKDSFAFFSDVDDDYYVENGYFEIYVGSSSRDLKLKEKIKIELDDSIEHSSTNPLWFL